MPAPFVDQAEARVMWHVEAVLERLLVAPLRADDEFLLNEAAGPFAMRVTVPVVNRVVPAKPGPYPGPRGSPASRFRQRCREAMVRPAADGAEGRRAGRAQLLPRKKNTAFNAPTA